MKRLPNPAKTLAHLGPGGTIELSHRRVRDAGNMELITVRIEAYEDGCSSVSASRRPGDRVFHILAADATGGWGPLSYDILMEYATLHGDGLSPDPATVSKDARAVWAHYAARRRDVTREAEPPGTWRSQRGKFPEAHFVYQKKPTLLAALAKARHVRYEGLWKPYKAAAPRRSSRERASNPTFETLPYTLLDEPGGDARYGFTLGREPYLVDFAELETPARTPIRADWGYEVTFFRARDEGERSQYDLVGEGGAVAVLGTTMAIMRAFLEARRPAFVAIAANKAEASRVRLYERLFSRLSLPRGYEGIVTDVSGARTFFLVRKDELLPLGSTGARRLHAPKIARAQNPVTPAALARYEMPVYAGYKDTAVQDMILRSIAQAERDFEVTAEDSILGCGGNGCVVQLADGDLLKITKSLSEVAYVDVLGQLTGKDAEGFVRIGMNGVLEVPFGYAYVREKAQRMLTLDDHRRYDAALERVDASQTADEYLKNVARMGAEHPALRALARTLTAAAKKGTLLYDVVNDNVAWRDDRTIIGLDAMGAQQ